MEAQITSIEALRKYAQGDIVELPPFAEGMPFVARIQRPSLMNLVKQGKIPNSLLKNANELFSSGIDGAFDEDNEAALSQMFEIMDTICEASFLEPTYQQIKEAGVQLTDEQLMFIFNYSQAGVRALESFRQQQAAFTNSGSGTNVQVPSERTVSNS